MVEIDEEAKKPSKTTKKMMLKSNQRRFLSMPTKCKPSKMTVLTDHKDRPYLNGSMATGRNSSVSWPQEHRLHVQIRQGLWHHREGWLGKKWITASHPQGLALLLRKLKVTGSIAYVEQEPILFSSTICNNILLGREFD